MKKSELRQLIREEATKLNEGDNLNTAFKRLDTYLNAIKGKPFTDAHHIEIFKIGKEIGKAAVRTILER